MSDIVIEIDLDNPVYRKSLKEAQDDSDKAGKEIGKSLNDNIAGTINESVNITIKNMGKTMENTSKSMVDSAGSVAFSLNQVTTAISGAGASVALLTPIAANFKSISTLAKDLANILFRGGGLFGFISALGSTSVALLAVSRALESTNNSFLQSVGFVTKFTSVLVGGLAAALTLVALKIAELAQVAASRLVSFFDEAAGLFNKAEQGLDTFRAVVDATNRTVQGTIGTFRVWSGVVNQIADTFNFTREEVRKAAQEILLVGPKLGLVESQMRQLLKVSSEYAKINGKDVFQTTVNFVNALNGNAQAVAALGVKLTQASLQQFAYSKGIRESVRTLSDAEKVQLRFEKVLKQYADVAGIGVIAANSLAESQKRLEIQQKRLQTALGEGARIIERNNIVAFAYDKLLGNISSGTAEVAGFIGALGARFLQVGGILLEFSIKIFAVIKGFKILKAVLASDIGIRAFAAQIPLLNLSLNQLLSNLTNTQVQIRSLGTLMNALSLTTSKALNSFATVITGQGTKGLTIIRAITGAIGQLRLAFLRLIPVVLPFLLPLVKIGAIVAVIVGAFKLLQAAFQEIEKRTGALTTLWEILLDTFNQTKSFIDTVIGLFNSVVTSIQNLVAKGFGLFVSGLTKVISVIVSLARRNPFGVFSQDTIVRLAGLENRLKGFREQIAGVGFDMRKLGDDAKRAIANINTVNLDEIQRKLIEVQNQYADFGQFAVDNLRESQERQLMTIKQALDNRLIAQQEYQMLREAIITTSEEAILNKQLEIASRQKESFASVANAFKLNAQKMKGNANELSKVFLNFAVRGIGNAFTRIGQAIASGGNALQAFADGVKAVFGDLANALGDYYIKQGVARLAVGEPGGAAAIAAGAALKVLGGALGGSATTSATAGGGGGIGVGTGGFQDLGTSQITEARADRPEPDTNLVVNINGDVLDGQETGNRIVDVLGDTFSKEGVVLRDVRFTT